MARDIDHIIERLEPEFPGMQIVQLKVAHPGVDDDGLWSIRVPGRDKEMQLESTDGCCPFLIESSFSDERFYARTVDEVVAVVRRLSS